MTKRNIWGLIKAGSSFKIFFHNNGCDKKLLCATFNLMKFPLGEFTVAELMAINKNLQTQTVRIFLNCDAAKGIESELVRLPKMRGNQFLYSRRMI
jgi:hypothetical protein